MLHLYALARSPNKQLLFLKRGPSDHLDWTPDEREAALYEREAWAEMVRDHLAMRGFHHVVIYPVSIQVLQGDGT